MTKSGGNSVHGSVYTFIRNDALDARNYFDPPTKPTFKMSQFGGSLSGPIQKDRIFFFANYEGSRKQLGAAAQRHGAVGLVPRPCQPRAGADPVRGSTAHRSDVEPRRGHRPAERRDQGDGEHRVGAR